MTSTDHRPLSDEDLDMLEELARCTPFWASVGRAAREVRALRAALRPIADGVYSEYAAGCAFCTMSPPTHELGCLTLQARAALGEATGPAAPLWEKP